MLINDKNTQAINFEVPDHYIDLKRSIVVLLVIFMIFPATIFSQATQSFQDGVSPSSGYTGTRDTYIHDANPNTNFGSLYKILIDGSNNEDYGILIKWDISSIPAGSNVQSATITLKCKNATNDIYEVYEMKRDWVESEATWNEYASNSSWETAGAQGSQDRGTTILGTITGNKGFRTINLNSSGVVLVQSWVDNPGSNYGVTIQDYDAGDGQDFYSSEKSNANYRPELTVTFVSSGTVYYVRTDGNDSNSGTSNSSSGAWLTIGHAASVMVAADTVKVQPGTYTTAGNHTINPANSGTASNPIVFYADGAGVIINGGNTHCKVFQINGREYIVIDGFEITNQPDCEGQGGAIKIIDSDYITMRNNIFYETGRDAIYLYGASSNCLVENNLMYNLDDDGITAKGGNHTIRNNTIYNCGVQTGSAGYAVESANTSGNVYENNIFWHNIDNTGGNVTYSNNNYINSVLPGTGNISSDPLFVNSSGNDFHLGHTAAGQSTDSPCIDAGNATAASLGLDTRTTRSDQVTDAGTVDMGYHYRTGLVGFTDWTVASGLTNKKNRYGVAWGDANNDGYIDLYITWENKYFQNNGDGTFTYVPGLWCGNRSAHWGDFDNDNDLDFFSTINSVFTINNYPASSQWSLQNNTSVGLTPINNLGDAAWIDYNEDGYLDLWTPNGYSPYAYMFENDGDGTFTGVQGSTIGLTANVNGEATVVADYDGDGHTDILYRASNNIYFWRSDGDGTYTDVSSTAGVSLTGTNGGYNGTAFGDYDNDGDLDLYGAQSGANKLFSNDGDGTFTDVTAAANAAGASYITRGVVWGDYDNDGDLDLYLAHSNGPNQLLRNNGDATFTDLAAGLGVADNGWSWGVSWGDFDLDGDLDLFVGNEAYNWQTDIYSHLYLNNLINNNYLKVKVRGIGAGGAPADGTGSRVELWDAAGTTLRAIREINGGEGLGSHSPRIVHFGLADAWGGRTATYTVKVRYTSGAVVVVGNVVPSTESIVIGGTTLNQTIEVVEGGLLADWRMDEDFWNGTANEVQDYSGNNYHGKAENGANTATGRTCKGGVFDGVDDYVSNPNTFTETTLTMSAWIKLDSYVTNSGIIDGYPNKWEFVMDNSGDKLEFVNWNAQGGYTEFVGNTSLSLNTWYFVTAVVEGLNCTLYLNGVPDGSFTLTNEILQPWSPNIGASISGTPHYFDGMIDEVVMFSRVLSTNEIQTFYNNQLAGLNYDGTTRTCPSYGLPSAVAWWAMDEPEWTGAADEVIDSTGNGHHGTAYGGVSTDDGQTCKSGMFDGTDDYVGTGQSLLNGLAEFTVAGWINPQIGGSRVGFWGQNDVIEFGFISGTTVQLWTPGGGSINVSYPFSMNEWHHVTAVGDGNSLAIYFDGSIAITGGSATTNYGSSGYAVNIGGGGIYDASGNFYSGGIDEVYIFDQALNSNQINYLYNLTHPCPTYTVTPIAYWALDEAEWDGTADEVVDGSGNGLHGTAMNGANTAASGHICYGGMFDGVDDNVLVADNPILDISGSFTVSAWVNMGDLDGIQPIVVKGGTNDRNYLLYSVDANVTYGYEEEGGLNHFYTGTANLTVGSWHHLVVTWDGSTVTGYFDAVVDGTPAYHSATPANGDWLYIATHPQDGTFFHGMIDEVKIFNRALTQGEVQTLFTETHTCPSYPQTPEYSNFPRLGWVMLGVPVTPDDPSIVGVLGDDFGTWNSQSNYWEVARWNTTALDYLLYSPNPSAFPEFASGLGFWVFQDVGENLVVDVTGISVSGDFTVDIVGPPSAAYHGKNMFANPYASKIDFSDVRISDGTTTLSINDAALAGWVNGNAYTWDVPTQTYELVSPDVNVSTDTIGVWEGLWLIQIDPNKTLDLIYREMASPRIMIDEPLYVSPLGDEVRPYARNERSSLTEWAGVIYLHTSDGEYRYMDQRFGVHRNAQEGFDGLDGSWLGPGFATTYGALYFTAPDDNQMLHDIRSTGWTEKTWHFTVMDVGVNGDWVIQMPTSAGIPGSIELSLESPQGTTIIQDLKETRSYTFSLSSGETRDFYLNAVVVEDTIPAHARIGFVQNPGVFSQLDLYVFPEEPLEVLTLFVDGNLETDISEIDQLNNIWRAAVEMYEDGVKEVVMTLVDLATNIVTDTLQFNFVLSDGLAPMLVQTPESGVTALSIPAGGIPKGNWIGIGVEQATDNSEVFSDVYSIQPFGMVLPQNSELMIPYTGNEYALRSLQVMRETANGWVVIPSSYNPVTGMIHAGINSSGRYQLRHSVADESKGLLPSETALLANYPNPFNATTIIPFLLDKPGKVKLTIFDLMGREVTTLVNGPQNAGYYKIAWSGLNQAGRPVASGVYLVLLNADDKTQTQKIMLLK